MKDRIVGTLEKKALTKAKEHKTTSVQAATGCSSCYWVFKLLLGVQVATGCSSCYWVFKLLPGGLA